MRTNLKSLVRRVLIIIAVALGQLSVGLRASAAVLPAVQVTPQSVTVSGVTVGGSVVLFYCSRVSRARSIAVRPDAIVLKDNDQDGSVQFVPPDGVPLRSVWVAVDETSGNYVVGSLPDFPVEETPISGDSFRRNVQNDIEALAEDIPTLVVLLVRPASGAWLENGFDGDASDGDGLLNGHVLMNFSSGITIDGTASAPHFLKNGDTVIAIDPGHLDVYTALVGR